MVECIRDNMYGFTKGEVYKVISKWCSEGESYIVKGLIFYDIIDDEGDIHSIEENVFKNYFNSAQER